MFAMKGNKIQIETRGHDNLPIFIILKWTYQSVKD